MSFTNDNKSVLNVKTCTVHRLRFRVFKGCWADVFLCEKGVRNALFSIENLQNKEQFSLLSSGEVKLLSHLNLTFFVSQFYLVIDSCTLRVVFCTPTPLLKWMKIEKKQFCNCFLSIYIFSQPYKTFSHCTFFLSCKFHYELSLHTLKTSFHMPLPWNRF